MPAVERALTLALAALLLGGCTRCEAAPPYQREVGVEVPAGEACPDQPTAQRTLVGGRTRLQETVLSIDSEPRREDESVARQVCCYEGRFAAQGEILSGKLCTDLLLRAPNDTPDLAACPAMPFDAETIFYQPREGQPPLGIFGDEVTSISGGPVVDAFTPGLDFCRYTATLSNDGAICR